MSKDYRYQRDEWDSVEEEDVHAKKPNAKRQSNVKTKQKRDLQRKMAMLDISASLLLTSLTGPLLC